MLNEKKKKTDCSYSFVSIDFYSVHSAYIRCKWLFHFSFIFSFDFAVIAEVRHPTITRHSRLKCWRLLNIWDFPLRFSVPIGKSRLRRKSESIPWGYRYLFVLTILWIIKLFWNEHLLNPKCHMLLTEVVSNNIKRQINNICKL